MELPSKKLKQISYNTRPKIEEHISIVMDKSTHEEHLSQPLQTHNKQFETATNFLTGYNGFLNVTNSNNKFFFAKTIRIKMVLYELLYHQVLKKSKVRIMKLKGLILKKSVLQKLINPS